ncbi:hypothetical protein ABLE68_12120 [Nocardioides sp. CN2-186]|uniref:hypothetical protein n=1 Tax=Nocardioides tweenelious TaxID=3156607 RepID=UPI0032B391D7
MSRSLAWLLLAGCMSIAVAALVAGEHTTSYSELRAAVAEGAVDVVTISGALPPGARGAGTVQVHWRSGLVGHVSEVVEARPIRAQPAMRHGLPVVASVEDDLTAYAPDLAVHHDDGLQGYSEIHGWHLPSWTGFVALAIFLSVFMLVVGGPQPWRANRWAWFWLLVFAAPVGTVGFLLLGGPSGLLPPRVGARRIRGGWGFLLALVVGAAIGSSAVVGT